MWRFPLPAFLAAIVTLSLPSAKAFGDDVTPSQPPPSAPPVAVQSPLDSEVAEHQGVRNNSENRAADLRRQVSGLQSLVAQVKQQLVQRKAQKSPVADAGGQPAAHDAQEQAADLQRQDRELHSQLQGLIAQLGEELQLEMRSPPASNTAEQQERQTARDAFKHAIADLQQQDRELQELIAGDQQARAQSEAQRPTAVPSVGEQHAARDSLELQAADIRNQIADLQRQDDALQSQLAEHRKELAQTAQELAQRKQDMDAARAEADRLRQVIETLREQHQAKEEPPTPQKVQRQQTAAAVPTRTAGPKTNSLPSQHMVARQPSQSTPTPRSLPPIPTPEPMQAVPAPSAAQQLQAARQWLSVGRPDEARRVLVMVQTQMVFQPVTPDQPVARSSNLSATHVGDAIHWLDMGVTGQAMQSISRAMNEANAGGGGFVPAWSAYPAGTP